MSDMNQINVYLQMFFIPPDHVEECRNESGIRVEFNVRGEDEVRVGRLPSDVPANVDGVVERAGVAICVRFFFYHS